ncbi:hypothetical protein AAZX31_12G125700 [Glycine max]
MHNQRNNTLLFKSRPNEHHNETRHDDWFSQDGFFLVAISYFNGLCIVRIPRNTSHGQCQQNDECNLILSIFN